MSALKKNLIKKMKKQMHSFFYEFDQNIQKKY